MGEALLETTKLTKRFIQVGDQFRRTLLRIVAGLDRGFEGEVKRGQPERIIQAALFLLKNSSKLN